MIPGFLGLVKMAGSALGQKAKNTFQIRGVRLAITVCIKETETASQQSTCTVAGNNHVGKHCPDIRRYSRIQSGYQDETFSSCSSSSSGSSSCSRRVLIGLWT